VKIRQWCPPEDKRLLRSHGVCSQSARALASISYTPPLRQRLEGVANVIHPVTNCESTLTILEKLDRWLGQTTWVVIHFNAGLPPPDNRSWFPSNRARAGFRSIRIVRTSRRSLSALNRRAQGRSLPQQSLFPLARKATFLKMSRVTTRLPSARRESRSTTEIQLSSHPPTASKSLGMSISMKRAARYSQTMSRQASRGSFSVNRTVQIASPIL
jgi:hypothetical protein